MKRPVLLEGAVGTVADFDPAVGQGHLLADDLLADDLLADDQRTYRFHCTQIVGGARVIAVGTPVRFDIVAGHQGTWEGSALRGADSGTFLCPVCAAPISGEKGTYEVCPSCGWEDDPVQSDDSGYPGGANATSLDTARAEWEQGLREAE